MKFHQMVIGAAIFLTACSSPKYVYHFDKYDYNEGKKDEITVHAFVEEESPLKVSDEVVVASAELKPEPMVDSKKVGVSQRAKSISDKVNAMSKSERKEYKKELQKELKSLIKKDVKKGDNVDSVKRTKVFDTLVALSIVFGVAGIVLITLANISNVFWIVGAISLAIGAFLFVKWVANGNG